MGVAWAFRSIAQVSDRWNKAQVESAKKTLESVDDTIEEIESIKELQESYKKARDNYEDSAQSKREYIDATRELAEEIGVEIKAEDLLAGNTKKINKQIRNATLENTKRTISSLESQQAAANKLIEDAKYTQEIFGNLGFLSDWSRHVWGRQSYEEAEEQKKQGEEALEKIKPELQQQKFNKVYEEAKIASGIDFYADTYSEFGKFKTEIVNRLEEIGFIKKDIESYLRQVLTDTETEYNLVYETELEFKNRLKSYHIDINQDELEEFLKQIRDSESTEILQEINLGKVKTIEELQLAFDKAKKAADAYKAAAFGQTFIDAAEILKAGKSIDDLSKNIKNKLNKELQQAKGYYNSLISAQDELNLLINQGATNEVQSLYMLRLSNRATEERIKNGTVLTDIEKELSEAYTPEKNEFLNNLKTAFSIDTEKAGEIIDERVSIGEERIIERRKKLRDMRLVAQLEKNYLSGAYMNPSTFNKEGETIAEDYNSALLILRPMVNMFNELKKVDIAPTSDEAFTTAKAIDSLLEQYASYQWSENDSETKIAFDEIRDSLAAISYSYKGIQGLNEEIELTANRVAIIESYLDDIRVKINEIEISNVLAGIFNKESGSVIIQARTASLEGNLDISDNSALYNILSETEASSVGFKSALEEWTNSIQYSDKETQFNFWSIILEKVNNTAEELIRTSAERDATTLELLKAFNEEREAEFESTKQKLGENETFNDLVGQIEGANVKDYEGLAKAINKYIEENSDAIEQFSGEYAIILQNTKQYLNYLDRINELNIKINKNNYVTNQAKESTNRIIGTFKEINSALKEIVSTLSKVGDGFILAAEDAEALNDKFPGILKNATDLHDGTIQLNKEVVTEVLNGDRAIVNSDHEKNQKLIQGQIDDLTAQLVTEESKQDAVKKRVETIKSFNIDQSKNAIDLLNKVSHYFEDRENGQVEADNVAKAIMAGNWEELALIVEDFPRETQVSLASVYDAYQGLFDDILTRSLKAQYLVRIQNLAIEEELPADIDWERGTIIPSNRPDGTSLYQVGSDYYNISAELKNAIRDFRESKTYTSDKIEIEINGSSNSGAFESKYNPEGWTTQTISDLINKSNQSDIISYLETGTDLAASLYEISLPSSYKIIASS